VAAQPLHVGDAGVGLVVAGEVEHLVGHVQPVGQPGGADPAGGEQDIDPAARAQVEHDLALVQLGDGDWIAAAERGEHRGVGQLVAVFLFVKRRANCSRCSGVMIAPGRIDHELGL
jgi:hypothetical protein